MNASEHSTASFVPFLLSGSHRACLAQEAVVGAAKLEVGVMEAGVGVMGGLVEVVLGVVLGPGMLTCQLSAQIQ